MSLLPVFCTFIYNAATRLRADQRKAAFLSTTSSLHLLWIQDRVSQHTSTDDPVPDPTMPLQ